MRQRIATLFLGLFLISTLSLLAQDKAAPSLYKRLGGYDAIASMVDDFIPRIATDPMLSKFFAGHGIDSKKRLRQLVVEKICEVTGGPCYYTGRTMKEAHNGLGITEEQWTTSTKHFSAMLDKFQVSKTDQTELLAIIGGMKGDIVAAPAAGSK